MAVGYMLAVWVGPHVLIGGTAYEVGDVVEGVWLVYTDQTAVALAASASGCWFRHGHCVVRVAYDASLCEDGIVDTPCAIRIKEVISMRDMCGVRDAILADAPLWSGVPSVPTVVRPLPGTTMESVMAADLRAFQCWHQFVALVTHPTILEHLREVPVLLEFGAYLYGALQLLNVHHKTSVFADALYFLCPWTYDGAVQPAGQPLYPNMWPQHLVSDAKDNNVVPLEALCLQGLKDEVALL